MVSTTGSQILLETTTAEDAEDTEENSEKFTTKGTKYYEGKNS